MCLQLAKEGWCGSDPQKIGDMDVYWVKKIIDYEKFYCQYKNKLIEKQREKK